MPEKPAEIAMLIYPGMTALDLVGPQQVFGYLPGVKVELVAKTKDVVRSDTWHYHPALQNLRRLKTKRR